MSHHYQNWGRTLRFSAERCARPTDLESLCSAVRHAQYVRPLGSSHSWTGLIEGHDLVLDLAAMPERFEVDGTRVRVNAGMSLDTLVRKLDAAGLWLPCLGGVRLQSIAGAVATGTHGSHAGAASLSSRVREVELVRGDGSRLHIGESDQRLSAAALNLGCLGTVVELVLECEADAPVMHTAQRALPYRSMMTPTLDELQQRYELLYFPFHDRALATTHRVQPCQVDPNHEHKQRLEHSLIRDGLFGGLEVVGALWPPLMPHIMQLAGRLTVRDGSDCGRWWQQMSGYPTAWRADDFEYAVPAAQAPAAMDALRELILQARQERIFFANVPLNIRWSGAEPELWLSPAQAGDVVYLDMPAFVAARGYRRFYQRVDALMQSFEARPHWGKWFDAVPTHRYGHAGEFRRVRAELDPEDKYLTAFHRRMNLA